MDKKRKVALDNGKNKKVKHELTKEGFLNSIKKLKLYTEEDRYYNTLSVERKPLEIKWD